MNFKENDLEILNSITGQTLHSQIRGDLSNTNLIEILNIVQTFAAGLDKAAINEIHADETLEAVKSETIHKFNMQTIDDLISQAQSHVFDCIDLPISESDEKIRSAIAKSIIGQAVEDCYIIVSPLILTILQAGGSSSYKQNPTTVSAAGIYEIGMLDNVKVYCNAYSDMDALVIVGTSNAVYTFKFKNISFV